MTPSKAKGTRTETAVVRYLGGFWPYVERRAMRGTKDVGDITGTPGLVWEVKAGSRLKIPEWLAQTEIERANAVADFGLLVVKPVGVGETRVGDWWSIMPLERQCELLKGAGY